MIYGVYKKKSHFLEIIFIFSHGCYGKINSHGACLDIEVSIEVVYHQELDGFSEL